tara:strand:+ start:450 stop:713 length:264 start_codon:yes stop_codon:yes gene_type:complete
MKKTKNITIGAIIFPSNSPNFIQPLFKGLKILEFNIPRNKKVNDIIKAHNLIGSELSKGQNVIIKKTKENNSPKLLLLAFFCILIVC